MDRERDRLGRRLLRKRKVLRSSPLFFLLRFMCRISRPRVAPKGTNMAIESIAACDKVNGSAWMFKGVAYAAPVAAVVYTIPQSSMLLVAARLRISE